MGFIGNEGEEVSRKDASRWAKNYREQNAGQVQGHFFGKEHYENILAQDGCVGVRSYHGIDDDGEQVLILVGVDCQERDLDNGIIVERAKKCPPFCGGSSSLNS